MRNKLWIVPVVIVALLAGSFAFATGGTPSREPGGWLTAGQVAHRGQWTADERRPENSLAAFAEAADNGYAVELDVHRAADGATVVMHNENVLAMTGTDGLVAEMTLTELRELRLNGGRERIPTLGEALDVIDGRVPVFVEIKNTGVVGPLEDEVAAWLLAYEGDACVMSFNPFSLEHLAEVAPDIPRGQLASAFEGEDLAWYEKLLLRNLLMNWASKPDFIAYDIAELPSRTTALQRWRERPLFGWTIETADDLAFAAENCDGFICNPGALQE